MKIALKRNELDCSKVDFGNLSTGLIHLTLQENTFHVTWVYSRILWDTGYWKKCISILQNHCKYSSTGKGKTQWSFESMNAWRSYDNNWTYIFARIQRISLGFDDCNVDSLSEFRLPTFFLLLLRIFISLLFVSLWSLKSCRKRVCRLTSLV